MANKVLGNNLKELRVKSGITQASLAEKTGVTRKTINTIENSVFVPSAVLALKIANILDVRVEDLFFLKMN